MASKNVTPAMAQAAYGIVHDHLEQLTAMAIAVEQRHRDACQDDSDDAPVTAWRFAQVMLETIGSTAIPSAVRAHLGLDELPHEGFVRGLLADTKLSLVRHKGRPGLDASH